MILIKILILITFQSDIKYINNAHKIMHFSVFNLRESYFLFKGLLYLLTNFSVLSNW